MRNIPKEITDLLKFSSNIQRYRVVEKDKHDMKNFLRVKRSLMFYAKNFYKDAPKNMRAYIWNTLTSEHDLSKEFDDKDASVELYMTPDALVIAYKNKRYLDSEVQKHYERSLYGAVCHSSEIVSVKEGTLYYGVSRNLFKNK